MHFPQAINSDLSVLIVCNKTGGTKKGDIKKFRIPESTFNLFYLMTLIKLRVDYKSGNASLPMLLHSPVCSSA